MNLEDLKSAVREVPDFPKPGVLYYDITTVLKDPNLFHFAIEEMVARLAGEEIDKIVAIESRGFLFGSAMAYKLKAGLVVVRKPNKLPYKTARVEYELEYGSDALECHVDSISQGEKVVIVDDVLATGGTAAATVELVSKMGAEVVRLDFFSELTFLKGRERLKDRNVHVLISY